MGIQIIIEDADVKQCGVRRYVDGKETVGWAVVHPSNGANLAYCDSEKEARAVRELINDIARQLRDPAVRRAHGLSEAT